MMMLWLWWFVVPDSIEIPKDNKMKFRADNDWIHIDTDDPECAAVESLPTLLAVSGEPTLETGWM